MRLRQPAEGRYGEPEIFGTREVLSLAALEGIKIALWEVFDAEPPEVSDQLES
jgi:hypothetical protein